MAREPGVGLDGERVVAERLLPLEHRGSQPVAVALRGQVARELVDQEAPVREDQDAHRPRSLDVAAGGDRLSRGRRMTEPIAADGARVLVQAVFLALAAVFALGLLVELVLVLLDPLLAKLAVLLAVAVLGLLLMAGDQLSEHARERVDLVTPELCPGGKPRRLVGQRALEPEHQGVFDLPLGRRRTPAGAHLGESGIERPPACAPLGEHLDGLFARVEERFAGPGLRPEGGRRQGVRSLRLDSRMAYRFLHGRSAAALPASQRCARVKLAPALGILPNGGYGVGLAARSCCRPTAFFMDSYAASALPSASKSSAIRA